MAFKSLRIDFRKQVPCCRLEKILVDAANEVGWKVQTEERWSVSPSGQRSYVGNFVYLSGIVFRQGIVPFFRSQGTQSHVYFVNERFTSTEKRDCYIKNVQDAVQSL